MGNVQPKNRLKQLARKYVEEEIKILKDEAKITDEQIHPDKNLEQTNKEETKESEETKAEEAKNTDHEKMTSAELNEQTENIWSLF